MFFNTKNVLSYQVKVLLKNIFTLPRFHEENFLRTIFLYIYNYIPIQNESRGVK